MELVRIADRINAMQEEIDRLRAERDRLRKYIEYMEYEDWTPSTVEMNRDSYLKPGDMTSD